MAKVEWPSIESIISINQKVGSNHSSKSNSLMIGCQCCDSFIELSNGEQKKSPSNCLGSLNIMKCWKLWHIVLLWLINHSECYPAASKRSIYAKSFPLFLCCLWLQSFTLHCQQPFLWHDRKWTYTEKKIGRNINQSKISEWMNESFGTYFESEVCRFVDLRMNVSKFSIHRMTKMKIDDDFSALIRQTIVNRYGTFQWMEYPHALFSL